MLEKRSLTLAGHATSLALEPEFWAVLERAARDEACSFAALIARIDAERSTREPGQPLSSACRVWALERVQRR